MMWESYDWWSVDVLGVVSAKEPARKMPNPSLNGSAISASYGYELWTADQWFGPSLVTSMRWTHLT